MLKWIPYAMVRIALAFIAGILVGIDHQDFIPYPMVVGLFLTLVLCYFISCRLLGQNRSLSLASGLIGLIIIFLAGYLNLINRVDPHDGINLSHFHGSIDYYLGQITGGPEERNHSDRIEITMIKIKSGKDWINVTGKSLVYVAKGTRSNDLFYGDRVLIKGPLVEVSPPGNPGEFDFRKFLRLRNIYHQQFAKGDQVRLVAREDHHGLLYYSDQVRAWGCSRIETFVAGKREQAITKALVLGATEGLDNDLLGAYASSGAMHILSVSGLHVGIIYAIILFFLRPFKSVAWSSWLVAGLSLCCLWLYAFVTGLSPSVLRAVAMFSFVAIAKPFGRQTNIYNTLAASAFFLLIYDPFLILLVGFQLSYLAVLGIVYLYRPLYHLWEPSFWLWDKAWQALCVSVAAQLATFALGLYYFHQFPVYFLISNLIVIPLSSFILLVGILLLALSSISMIAGTVGLFLGFLIRLLNGVVFFIEGLPGSLIEGVDITAVQCWLLLAATVSLLFLFQFRKFRYAMIFALLIGLYAAIQWNTFLNEKRQGRFIVYLVPGHGALEWIDHCQSFCFADSALLAQPDLIRYHIYPNRVISGVERTEVNTGDAHKARSFSGFRVVRLGGITVIWIKKWPHDLPGNVSADFLVIGNDALKSIEDIKKKVAFKKLIFDSSNSRARTARLMKEAESKNIDVHSVMSDGAFVVNL